MHSIEKGMNRSLLRLIPFLGYMYPNHILRASISDGWFYLATYL